VRATLLLALALTFAAASPAQDAPVAADLAILESVSGHWSGRLLRGGDEAALALDLHVDKGELTGTFDWPDLGYLGADILGAGLRDGQIWISLPLPLGALRLSAAPEPSRLEGPLQEIVRRANEWVTLPEEGRFVLRREAPPKRPYRVEPVRFRDRDVTLAGAVFLPALPGRRPAVVFIHGSGDSDRSDGAFYADQFARAGIVTLVYDKRGVGESGGQWREGGYENLARDAHAGLEFLRTRADVDPGRVGYVARSEGGWVGPLAVRLGDAAFLASVSGPVVSVADEDIDHYRIALREAGVSETEMTEALDLIRLRHRILLGQADPASLESALALRRGQKWFSVLNWEEAEDGPSMPFRLATLGYDPAPDLKKIGVPSLWIYGTDDKTIPAADSVARLMSLELEPRPLITVLPQADHALAATDYPRLPGSVQRSAQLLVDWINGQGEHAR
jgi:pimeloyl-ACP methyl ester carboxylesterase